MSVQLILYPQSYNGQYNAVSNVASEKVVDGILFTTINTASSYDSPTVSLSAPIINAPPTIINTWYRFRSTATGTPTLPTQSGGDLELYSTTTNTISGVYQRLSNLIVSQTYNVHILLDNSASGTITFTAWKGDVASVPIANVNYTISSLVGNFATFQFTAATTQDFIQITYTNSVAQTFTITDISVLPYFTVPTFTNFSLEDGQVICDLYQEEDIPLTLSVDEFKNVAEKVQSYSKDFNLPATKRNNLIFDNIFEITRSDDGVIFNPYIKTQCVLKQEGYILFEGYLRLIDVQDQAGEISYNVNLYSEAVALADVLKDRKFYDINLDELEHDYNKSNIKLSWNDSPTAGITYTNAGTSGYRDANNTLKYPFCDWTGQVLISNGNSGILDYPQLPSLQHAFRPFINVKYLINRIFQDTPFTWSSTLFDSADFNNLFMDFNWGSEQINPYETGSATFSQQGTAGVYAPMTPSYATLIFPADVTFGTLSGYDDSTSVFTCISDNTEYSLTYNINVSNNLLGSTGASFEIEWFTTGSAGSMNTTTYSNLDFTDEITYQGTINPTLNTGETLYCRFRCLVGTAATIRQGSLITYQDNTITAIIATGVMNSGAISQTARGQTNQWEFLKGIMTMFNIITMPDKENPMNINFESYADVFINDTIGTTLAARSIQHDWTEKVDVSEMKLLPLTDLNKKTVFKFVEDKDDYTFKVYKASTKDFLYGSKVYDASDYTILEGVDEVIATPFAATIPKPLFSQFGDFIVPAIFTSNDSETEFQGFENSARILYNNGKKTLNAGVKYYIPPQNALSSENQASFLQFSHLSNIPTIAATSTTGGSRDFNFGECQYFNGLGNTMPDNLFNLYWLPYYNELYNPNTRIMTLKVNLTPADVSGFKFNDKVMIKNRVFRVNKIDYKPNNLATVEFILVP